MTWQTTLAEGFASSEALLDFLGLPPRLACYASERQFKTRVPLGFAQRMKPGDPHDPLLLQVLASPHELDERSDFTPDPLKESIANPLPGLLHKYHGRVLLTLIGTCAVNCRFCFRRHFPYEDNNPGRSGWQAIFDYIRQDSSIHEVILSGGDPLLVTDRMLKEFVTGLTTIQHVKTLRFHTRIPIVLPSRIDESFLDFIKSVSQHVVMVLHCNHSQEINEEVRAACFAMKSAGCVLLNQSVLLRGINDNASVLAQLSECLFDCQVLPYYLHVLDKVSGTSHFDVAEVEVQAIYRALQGVLPGYLLPRLVREIAGEASKTLVFSSLK
ncbi:MAG: EF-P beta-lysylation protein EpmB [Legionellales bacterium RIFCSPHIGHO2_12_FULL_42_9]|nr:MAG: EF-P beta-lysylation protein EpmB [Legionellales bacterium RIFCSPHIGHO2_12_FULL_42_9]